jgi:hypothetical protein
MKSQNVGLLALALAGFMVYDSARQAPKEPVCPGPNCPAPRPKPAPRPAPKPAPKPPEPEPKPPRRPWGENRAAPVGAQVGGNVSPDGTEIDCDLPGSEHLKNKGGRDGAGLCVFTSIDHAARWQNVPQLVGFRDWMTRHPGGGYPQKVDQMIKMICEERGMPVPDYIQAERVDPELLKRACASGRMPGVTYSRSPTGRYGGGRIAHMVSLPHADDRWFCVLDNNYPGEDKYEWMTPEEARRAGILEWAVILLAPPPPPMPRNRT